MMCISIFKLISKLPAIWTSGVWWRENSWDYLETQGGHYEEDEESHIMTFIFTFSINSQLHNVWFACCDGVYDVISWRESKVRSCDSFLHKLIDAPTERVVEAIKMWLVLRVKERISSKGQSILKVITVLHWTLNNKSKVNTKWYIYWLYAI